jgi:hypothetical protein
VSNIQKEEESFHQKIGFKLRTKLVNLYIWSIAWYGDWALRKVDQKYLKNIENWYWRRMEKIS